MTIAETATAMVTVIGEALVDLVPAQEPQTFTALPGGSPYNVAIGLARLGQSTALMARIGDNEFGRMLREHAIAEGINLDAAAHASEPTTLAVVSLDANAQASYDFYLEGTADWQWTADEISQLPETTAVLHFGSIASWTPPGDQHILGLARLLRAQGEVLVSYDPNVRPQLLQDREHGRHIAERGVRLANLVKASADDIAWLYPDLSTDQVARHWLRLGATVVVITGGASGADAFTSMGPPIHRPASDVTVADTVGAGDSFTAGLVASLVRQDRHSPAQLGRCPEPELSAALQDAILAAALTCQRPGAQPPTLAELESARSAEIG